MKNRVNCDQCNRRLLQKQTGGFFMETCKRRGVNQTLFTENQVVVKGSRVNAGKISQRPGVSGTVPLAMMTGIQKIVRAE